ncbi:hypothetical protein [Nostoc sp. TCL26-01]|uniref:hypothetical protein n=1 Tax=Nostoc sp. TCL26-01 TaxID=2576904 RepID=UPI0015B98039|nr:hypothetical protein [Nostoc sp. TCL26-01]QLE59115.1 hypothetical protein FD725_28635 [Nostoc sp. TCL26-01]
MNRLIPWIQNVLLRQILIVCVIATTFFVSQSFTYNQAIVAQADTVKTPEGIYYKGTPDQNITSDNQVRKAQNRLKETAENVREKLNLDEETPRATKEYKKFVQRKVDRTVEPFTGKEGGYYQQPNRRRDR